MSIDRGTWEYLLATAVSIGAAALIYLSLEESTATECYRESLGISIAHSDDTLAGCSSPPFDAVRAQIADQRAKLAADATFEPAEPDPVAGRSMLVVWISLLAATAGVAGLSWVRSLFTIFGDIRPVWNLSVWSMLWSCVVTVGVLLIPFVLLSVVGDPNLSPFDDLHMRQIEWMTWVILGLSFPAAWGLRIIGHILKARSSITLADVARLGSQLRAFITMLGAILSIGVLATASRWQAIAALPGGKSIPSTVVLLFGAVYVVALATLYVPVQERWSAVAGKLVTAELHRQFRPLTAQVARGFSAPELAARRDLHSALGLGGALSGLQGSLSVLAPVIAAAVSSLFS